MGNFEKELLFNGAILVSIMYLFIGLCLSIKN